MVLVIGGSGEDRNGYAKKRFPGCEVLPDYQETVKKQLLEGLEPQTEVRKLLAEHKKSDGRAHGGDSSAGADGGSIVITTLEMGCGVVPMDAFERRYREENGRVNCLLAECADEVIRVLCGIGMQIK